MLLSRWSLMGTRPSSRPDATSRSTEPRLRRFDSYPPSSGDGAGGNTEKTGNLFQYSPRHSAANLVDDGKAIQPRSPVNASLVDIFSRGLATTRQFDALSVKFLLERQWRKFS